MMISDDERREVVARLREWLAIPWYERPWSRDAMQSLGKMVGAVPGEDIVERIADLIDRPTCNDVGDNWKFRCSACGCELDILEMEVGEPTMWKDGAAQVPKYCPSCGAEVVTTSD